MCDMRSHSPPAIRAQNEELRDIPDHSPAGHSLPFFQQHKAGQLPVHSHQQRISR